MGDSGLSRCLRPEFTQLLATGLLAGQSINLLSPHGQGRRRTLQDLRHILPESLHTCQVNMRDYHADIKGFYHALCMQLRYPCREGNGLDELFKVIGHGGQKTLLILHNFDEIRNIQAMAGGYNQDFMQALNSVRNRKTMTLLCVGECEYDNYLLNADGSELSGSELDAAAARIPPLTFEQLLNELQRRALPLSAGEFNELADWLLGQYAPYSILDERNMDWFTQRCWRL